MSLQDSAETAHSLGAMERFKRLISSPADVHVTTFGDVNTKRFSAFLLSGLLAVSALGMSNSAQASNFDPIESGAMAQSTSSEKVDFLKQGYDLAEFASTANAPTNQIAPAGLTSFIEKNGVSKATALHITRSFSAKHGADSFAINFAVEMSGGKPTIPLSVESDKAANFQVEQMFTLNAPEKTSKAIIFVGGVNDSYHFWDKQIAESIKQQPNTAILGFEGSDGPGTHAMNKQYMSDNAQTIAKAMQSLNQQGIKDITVIAHSLGGLVSKKALLIANEDQILGKFNSVSFTAVSSPFGGYAAAMTSDWAPDFIKPLTKAFNVPMALDMSPTGVFLKSLSEMLSANVTSTLIENPNDSIVSSDNEHVIRTYEQTASSFSKRMTVDAGNSHEFASSPSFLKSHGVELIKQDISHHITTSNGLVNSSSFDLVALKMLKNRDVNVRALALEDPITSIVVLRSAMDVSQPAPIRRLAALHVNANQEIFDLALRDKNPAVKKAVQDRLAAMKPIEAISKVEAFKVPHRVKRQQGYQVASM